jgi:hypothetical protein
VEEAAGKIMNNNMGNQEFYNFLLSDYRCMHANLADDGSFYVWAMRILRASTSARPSRMRASICPAAVSG